MYTLYDYSVKDFELNGRFFNITFNYTPEEGTNGIEFTNIVETFDPELSADVDRVPQDVYLNYTLGKKLPTNWNVSPITGFLELTVPTQEFKKLLPHSALRALDQRLYDVVKHRNETDDS